MKRLLLLALVLAIGGGIYAQTIRLAYINSTRVMAEANDTRDAQRLFEIEREKWNSEIDDMTAEITRLENEYERRKLTLSTDGKTEAEAGITAKKRERQQKVENIYGENGEAERVNSELLAPIMSKLREILNTIAIDENYAMIFDITSSGIVWAQERFDITQQVIIEMNKKQ